MNSQDRMILEDRAPHPGRALIEELTETTAQAVERLAQEERMREIEKETKRVLELAAKQQRLNTLVGEEIMRLTTIMRKAAQMGVSECSTYYRFDEEPQRIRDGVWAHFKDLGFSVHSVTVRKDNGGLKPGEYRGDDIGPRFESWPEELVTVMWPAAKQVAVEARCGRLD